MIDHDWFRDFARRQSIADEAYRQAISAENRRLRRLSLAFTVLMVVIVVGTVFASVLLRVIVGY